MKRHPLCLQAGVLYDRHLKKKCHNAEKRLTHHYLIACHLIMNEAYWTNQKRAHVHTFFLGSSRGCIYRLLCVLYVLDKSFRYYPYDNRFSYSVSLLWLCYHNNSLWNCQSPLSLWPRPQLPVGLPSRDHCTRLVPLQRSFRFSQRLMAFGGCMGVTDRQVLAGK